jgi:hypothetical protein
MASWRERRAWRAEFKSLGVRQTSDRERAAVWAEEKAQEARHWLRSQEHRPYYIGAVISAVATVLGAILGALIALIASHFRGAC